jgi:hypothetical protein
MKENKGKKPASAMVPAKGGSTKFSNNNDSNTKGVYTGKVASQMF